MKELVTVIVPVYNTELYLNECLDSILQQTYQELQIILIDDGSTDSSGEICDAYVQNNLKIQVIHQKNCGVSNARNIGLSFSVGEYIMFVDSDDILPLDAIEKMVSNISNVDMLLGSLVEIDELGKRNNVDLFLPDKVIEIQEFIECLFYENKYGYQGYLGNKLYRKKIIVENEIQFENDIKYNEDRLFLTQYCMNCTKIRMIESIVYYYRQRIDSAQDIAKKKFVPAILTELLAFERMKIILENKYPSLFYRLSQLIFEKSLYWIKKMESKNLKELQYVKKLFNENVKILLKSPEISVYKKMKIIGHYLLKR